MTTPPYNRGNAALVLQLRTAERRLKETEERMRFAEAQARMLARAADNEKAEARTWRERYEAARASQPDHVSRAELDILGTDERLAQALANVGVDLACGGCAARFYTGSNWPSDVHTCKRTVAAILANPPVAAPLAVEPSADVMHINCQCVHADASADWYQLKVTLGTGHMTVARWNSGLAAAVPMRLYESVIMHILCARGYVVTGDAVDADPTTLTYDNPEATHEPP